MFINVTRYLNPEEDDCDTNSPHYVNASRIVHMGRNSDYVTVLYFDTGSSMKVDESLFEITEQLRDMGVKVFDHV